MVVAVVAFVKIIVAIAVEATTTTAKETVVVVEAGVVEAVAAPTSAGASAV